MMNQGQMATVRGVDPKEVGTKVNQPLCLGDMVNTIEDQQMNMVGMVNELGRRLFDIVGLEEGRPTPPGYLTRLDVVIDINTEIITGLRRILDSI